MSFITFTPPYTANGKTVSKFARQVSDDATNKVTAFFQPPMTRPMTLWSGKDYNAGWTDADVEARIRAAMTSGEFAKYLAPHA